MPCSTPLRHRSEHYAPRVNLLPDACLDVAISACANSSHETDREFAKRCKSELERRREVLRRLYATPAQAV